MLRSLVGSEMCIRDRFNTIKKFLETNQIQRTIFLTPIQDYEFEVKRGMKNSKIKIYKDYEYNTEPTKLTKIYEEFMRKNVDELELFEKEPKGELTVVISEKKINKNLSEKLTESDMNIIKKMINKLSTKEITDILSKITNVPKKEIYNYCLELKNEK